MWDLEDRVEDAMPPIVLFDAEWERWLAETQQAPTDAEIEDMADRNQTN